MFTNEIDIKANIGHLIIPHGFKIAHSKRSLSPHVLLNICNKDMIIDGLPL